MTLWEGVGRRRPLEFSRWRTSVDAMAMALMRRWFGVLGRADGRESLRGRETTQRLFKYHLVFCFITQTYTGVLAACLQLHSHYFTQLPLCSPVFSQSSLRLRPSPVMRRARAPCCPSPIQVLNHGQAGAGGRDTLWSQVIKPRGVMAVRRLWRVEPVTSVHVSGGGHIYSAVKTSKGFCTSRVRAVEA